MELVEVRIGACTCPESPHADGDVVRLLPKLGLSAGIIVQEPIADWLRLPMHERPGQEFMRAELAERYLTVGVVEWNLVDEHGPIPVNPVSIRANLLEDYERSAVAANKADDLYADVALDPLQKLVSESLRDTPTKASTSATRRSTRARPKPRKRSSTSTSQTDGIATTSP